MAGGLQERLKCSQPIAGTNVIRRVDESGQATNVLAIQVAADSVHFLANGQRVQSFAKSEMHGFNTDGQVGLRVNHNLDVHVASFEVKK